ncbi:MAG TPA: lipopolysaccharide biosynthesis protein [Acidimicrobiales bacterium]|nr:lipopolysaccharide biosynthesis protein [Acidimicrobiales bacterium]
MSDGKVVFRGSLINYGSFLLAKLAIFGSTVVLARLLVPRQFGIVGYALLVLGFLYVLKNFGMGTALIYGQGLTEEQAGVLFYVAVLASIVSVVIAWAAAPSIATFFHDHRIVAVTRVLSFSLVLNALAELHNAQLQKRMRFGRRAVPLLASSVAKGAAAIGFAAAGLGYWSLVWGQLVGDGVFAVVCWALYPWFPRLSRGRWAEVSHLLRFGMNVAFLEVVALLLLNVDNLVVGRTRGTTSLGMYDLAFTIPQMISIGLAGAISQAVFPVLATMQADVERLRERYFTVLRYVALIMFPLGAGLSVVAPSFVRSFYGRAWWPMIPAARALALYAMVFAIGWGIADVHQALGRPDRQWRLDLVHLALLTPAVVIGVHVGGITGVAWAQVVVVVPLLAVRLWVVARALDIPASRIVEALRVPAAGGAALYLVCASFALATERTLGPVALLACQVALGVTIYGAVVAPAVLKSAGPIGRHAPSQDRGGSTAPIRAVRG